MSDIQPETYPISPSPESLLIEMDQKILAILVCGLQSEIQTWFNEGQTGEQIVEKLSQYLQIYKEKGSKSHAEVAIKYLLGDIEN